MGPFPHDAPPATITDKPAGTDGFEFVEFAHEDPVKLEELFAKMGYMKVATHKTKAISVWRQGDINYIVNAEPGSHAMKFV
jgi:4-hydroxyphenylpyruvate dioxygenase